jgi:hypothetical protein
MEFMVAGVEVSPARPTTRTPKVLWLWGAAALAGLVLVPFLVSERKSQEPVQITAPADADALMNAINLHLLRTVPAPMEPLLVLIPRTESKTKSGGDQ